MIFLHHITHSKIKLLVFLVNSLIHNRANISSVFRRLYFGSETTLNFSRLWLTFFQLQFIHQKIIRKKVFPTRSTRRFSLSCKHFLFRSNFLSLPHSLSPQIRVICDVVNILFFRNLRTGRESERKVSWKRLQLINKLTSRDGSGKYRKIQ